MISTTTRTGQALARERFGEDRVFYCPLDLPWAVRAYLNALRPQLLILAETEFWPNLLNGCFRGQIPVAVVNARISDRSWPRYRMLRRLVATAAWAGQPGAGAERDRRGAAEGDWLPAGAGHGERQPEVRCARCAGGRGNKAAQRTGRTACASWWPEARWKAKRPRCLKRGRSCSKAIRNWRWCWLPGIRSALARWRRCSRDRGFRGCGGRSGRPACGRPVYAQAAQSRAGHSSRHHRRTGVGVFAGRGGLCGWQPDSVGRPQSAGAGAVWRSDRDGSALCQLPRHHGRPAGARRHSHRAKAGSGPDAGRPAARFRCCGGHGRSGAGRSSKSRLGQRSGRCTRWKFCLPKGTRSHETTMAGSFHSALCRRSGAAQCEPGPAWRPHGGCAGPSSASAISPPAARAKRP